MVKLIGLGEHKIYDSKSTEVVQEWNVEKEVWSTDGCKAVFFRHLAGIHKNGRNDGIYGHLLGARTLSMFEPKHTVALLV